MTAQLGRHAPNTHGPVNLIHRPANGRPRATWEPLRTEAQVPGWCTHCGRPYLAGAQITLNQADILGYRAECCT